MSASAPRRVRAGELEGLLFPPLSGTAPRQLALALHGYASDSRQFVSIVEAWRAELRDTEFFLPDAPAPCALNKTLREWFPLTRDAAALRSRIVAAEPFVSGAMEALARARGLGARDVILVGFSQGAMLALHVGIKARIKAIVSFAGALTKPTDLSSPETVPPVFLAQGTRDRMVEPVQAIWIAQGLASVGCEVTVFFERDLGHEISPTGVRAATRFLHDVSSFQVTSSDEERLLRSSS